MKLDSLTLGVLERQGISLEELERAEARKGLLEFTEATFDGYQTNWHHRKKCDAINKWIEGEYNRLMIFEPPRHGKSELVSRRLPAFLLGRFPNDHVMATSYAQSLSSRMNRDVQRIIDSRPYSQIFPNIILPRSSQSQKSTAGYVRTSSMFEIVGYEGSYVSSGIGGALTGMGANWAIIDDPVKNMEEAMSRKTRDKVWEWYTSTLLTRLEEGGKILLTMTRWHHDDLAGRILQRAKNDPDAEQWEVLNLPAICDEPDRKYEEREEGEPLWRAKKPLEELNRIKATVPSKIWSSLYQQNPTPDEGSLWQRNWIKPIKRENIPEQLTRMGTDWDLAYTAKEKNSASAFVVSAQHNNNIYILNCGAVWKEFPELIQFMHKFEGVQYIEDKASGKSAAQTLRRAGITCKLMEVQGDKISRTRDVTPHGEAGKIFIVEELHDYLFNDRKQGIIHLSEENDDIDLNDALTQAIKRHLGGALSNWQELAEDTELMPKRRSSL